MWQRKTNPFPKPNDIKFFSINENIISSILDSRSKEETVAWKIFSRDFVCYLYEIS